MKRLWQAVLVLMFIATLALFAAPGLDIRIAAIFFGADGEFWSAEMPVIRAVYEGAPLFGRVLAAALIALFALSFIPRLQPLRRNRRAIVFLWLALALGPGLAVETFKAEVPRPRPDRVIEFGGTKMFHGLGDVDGECRMNCAFPSAHASVGAFLLAFAFVWPRRRDLWIVASLAATLGIGLARMAVGAHWLSDVLFAFWIVAGVVLVLRLAVYPREFRRPFARIALRPGMPPDGGTQLKPP
jgi:lipid A 4'-phosphatase